MYVAEVPYSPPVANPWTIRQMMRSAAAHIPIWLREGRIATTNEAEAITRTEKVRAERRPCRSAQRPKNQEPSGRMRKVMANTA